MFHYIYALPLRQVWALMLITVPLWSFGQLSSQNGLWVWRNVNRVLLVLSVFGILTATVLRRSPDGGQVFLMPFHSFIRARIQRELYREMLMNVLLFFPLGLSLSSALPQRISVGRRFALTVLAGFALSLMMEAIQFVFRLGLAETDDVLTNTFGTALGAIQLPLSRVLWKLKR